MQQYNPEQGQLMLRFEHFKFVRMLMKQWNRSIVTPMRLVHTLTPEPDSPMKKTKTSNSDCVNVFVWRHSINYDPRSHFPVYAKGCQLFYAAAAVSGGVVQPDFKYSGVSFSGVNCWDHPRPARGRANE